MLYAVILFVVAGSALLLIAKLYSGPSASRTLKRRVEQIKERHGDMIAGHAQAQIRKLFAQRASRIEGFASSLIPKPALLRRRLEMTGKNISLAKYSTISLGICLFITTMMLVRGSPILLAMFAGLFFGLGGPYYFVGKMIKRRINKFNSNFPDAIELILIQVRQGLEHVGGEVGVDECRGDDIDGDAA